MSNKDTDFSENPSSDKSDKEDSTIETLLK